MAKRDDDFSFSFSKGPGAQTAELETPDETADATEPLPEPELAPSAVKHKQFRILILADFTGRTNRSICNPGDVAGRKVRAVDADNLNKTLAALRPEIRLPVSDKTMIPLAFKALEDFRPDALIPQVPAFQGMLNLRRQLMDNKTFKQAAETVRKFFAPGAPAGGAKAPPLPQQPSPPAALRISSKCSIARWLRKALRRPMPTR